MQKILIIEDDKIIREELKNILDNAGYCGIILENFSQTLEDIIKINPDLVLLDINIPFISGETILKELRKKSNIPVIMVTSKNTLMDEALSMSYGADDYITKPYNPTILLLHIGAVLRRLEQDNDFINYKNLKIVPAKGIIENGKEEIILTKNEMIILVFLLNNRGKIVDRDEIMTDLWNNSEYINDNALSVNISRLRAKLKTFNCEDIIETRKNQGYIIL